MRVEPFRTPRVSAGDDLDSLIAAAVPTLAERSVVAVTSKIVALCEGRVEPTTADKHTLTQREAELFTDPATSQWGIALTVNQGVLIPAAGIDESNADGMFVLWPADCAASAERIRDLLRKRDGLTDLGVVITDSTTQPLRRGVTGVALGRAGFHGVRSYIGEPDLFGREMHVSESNIADALAVAAVFVMGEGAEQTPIAVLTDLPGVEFDDAIDPTDNHMPWADDIYRPLLDAMPWQKGGRSK